MRVICTSGPILKDGRSPRRGETALVGNTASQERGNAAMQHSGVSLTPAGGAMGQLRGNFSIFGLGHIYGLLDSRRAGWGDCNPTATACVQQVFYRFVSGLCASFWRCTRTCAAIWLASHGRRDVVKRFQPLSFCKGNPGGVQRQPTRSLSPDGSRHFTLQKIARTSRVS